MILADDLGYADLGCQGSAEVRSPQIDSIAANGVRCTAAYVTAPQCCPSRAGLMTGRYQNRFGFEANWPGPLTGKVGLPVSERTIAGRLKAAGYATGMIGKQNTSRNDPCRGVKGDLLEGGIRVPFLVQWKGRIPAGVTCAQPVISLDILATALAAAGLESQPDGMLDGVNLLPLLTGEKPGAPHDALYWRFRFPPNQPALYRWAIRQGDWKLVKNNREPVSLYHLATDIGETKDLAAEQPERVAAMQAAWQRWDARNQEPLWTEPRVGLAPAHHVKVQTFAAEIRMECTGHDPQLLLTDIPSATGPFTLELKIKSTSKGPGQIFWSTAAKPEFVAAQCADFAPQHDGQQWHDYTIALPPITPALTHLRLDPGTAPGLVRIARLVLRDADGKVVKAWLGNAEPARRKAEEDRR